MAKTRTLPKKRVPVYGYMAAIATKHYNGHDFYVIRQKTTKEEKTRVVIADASAWKAIRKSRAKKSGKIIVAWGNPYHNRLIWNGENAIVLKTNNLIHFGGEEPRVNPSEKKFILADASLYKIVRKKGVKPLKPEPWHGLEKTHSSHSMSRWKVEIRCYSSTDRFYSVRHCTRCGHEQATSVAGKFSDRELRVKCKPT